MRLISLSYPFYRLQHDSGFVFDVRANKVDGQLTFEPLSGWNVLSKECQQPTETLLEEIDECIYNATPHKYEVEE
jgi:hypothetical protein